MQKVFVLDTNKKPLMPTHPAKARKLLSSGRAAVYRYRPFTIILRFVVEEPELQPVELKIDPGSKVTGLALVQHNQNSRQVIWAANLHHRGQVIKASLDKRRSLRHNRRNRKTRYRKARFLNRIQSEGWLAPSLRSRVENVSAWGQRLIRFVPVSQIAVETARFDTHKLVNPEVSGVQYQQGELWGYELREYLLEKWGRRCAYCKVQGVPLQVEHIIPRSKGGSNRVSNLTLACESCNLAKGNQDVRDFMAHDPASLEQILAQAQVSLRDAAAINSIRYAIGKALKLLGHPVTFWSAGQTKYNRLTQGYAKDHWLDAACIGETGKEIHIPTTLTPLTIRAAGRGSRQMVRMDKYGFPRTRPKSFKQVGGFLTGDLVKAVVPTGKKAGTYIGRVAVRANSLFRIGSVDGINQKYCRRWQRADGYEYNPLGLKPLSSHR